MLCKLEMYTSTTTSAFPQSYFPVLPNKIQGYMRGGGNRNKKYNKYPHVCYCISVHNPQADTQMNASRPCIKIRVKRQ